jgi:hypothetical protein
MAARNLKVAQESDVVLAYTWADGDEPDDGGTRQTWNLAEHADRRHIRLGDIAGGADCADWEVSSSQESGRSRHQRQGAR